MPGRSITAELPDGNEHTLRFTLEGLIMVEEELDKPIGEAFQQVGGLRVTRALLRAALSNEEEMRGRRNRPWSDAELHALMPPSDLGDVRAKLREALRASFPDRFGDGDEEPDEGNG